MRACEVHMIKLGLDDEFFLSVKIYGQSHVNFRHNLRL